MIWFIFLLVNDLTFKISGQECQCGKNKINERRKRIYNGQDAQIGEFPWQIHLQISKNVNVGLLTDKYYGGVLISKKHILTCAKCMQAFFEIRYIFMSILSMYFTNMYVIFL